MSSLLSDPTPWVHLPPGYVGGIIASRPHDSTTNELLVGMAEVDRGRSYLMYLDYSAAATLFDRLVGAQEDHDDTDKRVVDAFADCAARMARARGIRQYEAERVLDEAVALRDRLPRIFECLRDGVIAPWQAKSAVTRTDLLDPGSTATSIIDVEIAETLRTRPGVWSRRRFRDMVDRIIFRHDPDAVRDRRRDALNARGVWTESRGDGMAEIVGVMSAENTRIAAGAVIALADAVCKHDGRTLQQRRSDAMFALLSGTSFTCECTRSECPAVIPSPATMPPSDAKVVIHVVCDEGTLNGTAANAGFVEGHGLVSDEHIRDLAARPDAMIRPLVPGSAVHNPDGTITLPAHIPSDPSRPSAFLDSFIRVRDGYCADPGCDQSAWSADLDHVHEYDHDNPGAGGRTTADGMNAKCRFGHLLKTFGAWVDDQFRDAVGRLRTEYTTPEGLVLPGEAETNEDLFPGLRRLRFVAPTEPEPPPDHFAPQRTRTRLAAKYARRQAERAHNRKRREADPPPF